MAKMKTAASSPAEHDEVADGVHEAVVFVQNHYLAIIGAIVLAVIAILGYNSMMNSRAQAAANANDALTSALGSMNQLMQSTDPAQRKDTATKMIEGLDKLIADYPNSPLVQQAIFLKGRAYYETDDFDNAQKAYETCIAKATDDETAARAEIALGYAHENHSFLVGDPAQQVTMLNAAYDEYQKASKRAAGTYLHYYALMSMARCKEALHKTADAITLYQQVIDGRPSPYVTSADGSPMEVNDPSKNATEQEFLRNMLNKAQSNLSFASTAQLRIENLKAQAAQPQTVAPAVAAPVATPVATPVASNATPVAPAATPVAPAATTAP